MLRDARRTVDRHSAPINNLQKWLAFRIGVYAEVVSSGDCGL
jgi:hypothetical protein